MLRRINHTVLSGFVIWLLACTLLAAGEPAPETPAPVPEWALGVLSARQFGPIFDRLAAYANAVVPNSGPIATQMALHALFPFPAKEGINGDGPVLLYVLDPATTGVRNENAIILSVADPAALKRALTAALGAPKEEAGVLTFTLPQALPQPDKTLLFKIENDKALIAPNADVLKKLEELTMQQALQTLTGTNASDVALTLKIDRFKQLYGALLESSLQLGVMMSAQDPKQAEKLNTQVKTALATLWQVDVVEVHLTLRDKAPVPMLYEADRLGRTILRQDVNAPLATLELRIRPKAATTLATACEKGASTLTGKALRLLSPNAPLVATWTMSGAALAKKMREETETQTLPNAIPAEIQKVSREAAQALSDMLATADGEAAFALDTPAQGIALFAAMETTTPENAAASVPVAIEKLSAAINAAIKAQGGPPDLVAAKALPPLQYGGSNIQQSQFEIQGITPEDQTAMGAALGWPVALDYAIAGKNLLVTFGKNSLESIKAAVDRQQWGIVFNAPQGTYGLLALRPIELAKTLLALTAQETGADAEQLTTGLPSLPAVFSLQTFGGAASLRIDIPAAVPQALITLSDRLKRAKINILEPLQGAKGTVPAPPLPVE